MRETLRQEDMYPESDQARDKQSDQTQNWQPALRCMNCDIEILWPPVVVQGKTYCCTGCAADGPCSCDYSRYRSRTVCGVIHYDGLLDPQRENDEKSSKQP
ncbi:MAG TPA: hypothetical protein VHZ51_17575 [Ktedonobacteraceae bacterium]|nr:hypothetical protein [Ktedonobacteraceae bacterium]